MTTFDAIVVGGGIVGSACAAACARDGLSVALVDPGTIGHGATNAAMGHIVLMDDSIPQLLLTRYSQSLWAGLAPHLPPSAEHQSAGTLWVAADAEEFSEATRKQNLFANYDIASQLLNPSELRVLEPNLRRDLTGGLLVPADSIVQPTVVAQALSKSAICNGTVLFPTEVLRIGDGSVHLTDGTRLQSPRIVNAAGDRALTLTSRLPVRRRKGHVAITDPFPAFVTRQVVELGYLKSAHSIDEDTVAFNVQPRPNGQILIGSSRQFDSEGPEVESSILDRMYARAFAYMPRLANASIQRVWTGFRTATPDKLPLIGPWPGDETVFLATGHEGLGITTSLATAALLADRFAGRTSAIPPEPYLPSRFTAKTQHKEQT